MYYLDTVQFIAFGNSCSALGRPKGALGDIRCRPVPMNRKEARTMRYLLIALVLLLGITIAAAPNAHAASHAATGAPVTYKVNGQDYEGYYVSPEKNAPLGPISKSSQPDEARCDCDHG